MSDTNLATDTPEPVLNADPAPETAPELPLETPPQPRMIPADVLVREVTPLRAKNRELEAALEEHRRRDREHQELIARLQRSGNGQADPPPQPRHEPQQQVTQSDIDRRAMELNFQRDASQVSSAGVQAYGVQWNDSLNILQSFDLNTPDFISSIMDVAGREKTHEVVRAITEDPSKAAAMATMSPARRIAEITRISERMDSKAMVANATKLSNLALPAERAAAPAKTVSQAPRPAPHVEANTGKTFDWNSKDQDKMSDVEWSKAFNERMQARSPRR
jgi:hypothetical protein